MGIGWEHFHLELDTARNEYRPGMIHVQDGYDVGVRRAMERVVELTR